MSYYRVNEITGCWIWQGPLSAGYGITRRNGKVIGAHRLAYEDAKGPIPDGMQIHHRCEQPLCVNPDHLTVVTKKQNARGRRPSVSKLTPEDVYAIRRSNESRRVLAERFGITPVYVSMIRTGRAWGDLPEEAAA